jgi:beta-glucosidase
MRCNISRPLPLILVLLGYVGTVQAAVNQSALAANLEHFWSYGRSPPVYPTPQMSGSGGWEESYQYARQLVSQMTNDEKNNLTYGYVCLEDPSTLV